MMLRWRDQDQHPAHLRHHGEGNEAGDENHDNAADDDAGEGRTDRGVNDGKDRGAVEHHHFEPRLYH